MNNIIFVIALTILSVTTICLAFLMLSISKKLGEYHRVITTLTEINKMDKESLIDAYESVARMEHTYESTMDLLNTYGKQFDIVLEQYESIRHGYELMCEAFSGIKDQHKKLLDCWKSIDERYDNTYEQFKTCIDKINKISTQENNSLEAFYVAFSYENESEHDGSLIYCNDEEMSEQALLNLIANTLNKTGTDYKDINIQQTVDMQIRILDQSPGNVILLMLGESHFDIYEPSDSEKEKEDL